MSAEPAAKPMNRLIALIKRKTGDKAETYNLRNHKAGAGQRTLWNNIVLSKATKKPETTAKILATTSKISTWAFSQNNCRKN